MGKYAKAIVAVLGAALTAIQTTIPMSDAAHGWVTVAITVITAASVYMVPNTPDATGR